MTGYCLNHTGFEVLKTHGIQLISLAAHKFISDIAHNALQHHKMKGVHLTMEELTPALSEYISAKKPHYWQDWFEDGGVRGEKEASCQKHI